MIIIKNRFSGKVIIKSKKRTIKEIVVERIKKYADLRGADLRGADLRGADLRSANLGDANLGGTDLRSANLGDANLRSANLRSANLGGANLGGTDLGDANLGDANLRVKIPPVNSHQFISEILYRKSTTEIQLVFSARIRLQNNECWKHFIKLAREKRVLKWAKEILFQWNEFKMKFREETHE